MATEEVLEEKKPEEAVSADAKADAEKDQELREKDQELSEKEGSEEVEEEKEVSTKGKKGLKKAGDKTEEKPGLDSRTKEPVTPSERPTRVRKLVERYSEPSSARVPVTKLYIEKGAGKQLRDIPNVAYKLSKKKPDENLQILHTILYAKKAKVHTLKKNIGQFSGFVWIENEEKQREKVKEKFDKLTKEKLMDFCDVLNIPLNKTIKKEELTAKLLEFLESPHATTEILLADKEQKGTKRKKVTPSKTTSGEASKDSAKKRKQTSEVSEKQKEILEVEEHNDKSDSSDTEDDKANDEGEDMKDESEPEHSEEDVPKEQKESKKSSSKKISKESSGSKKKATPVKKESPAKYEKKNSSLSSKKGSSKADTPSGSSSKAKVSDTKKQKVEKEEEEKSDPVKEKVKSKKEPSKSPAKKRGSSNDSGKGKKSSKKAKAEPSRGEMHAIVVDILKEVDFNTATLSDILKQLGFHFDMDLLHRKAEVKEIITDVINNMTDEEEEEELEEKAESGDYKGKDGDNKNTDDEEDGDA